MGNMTVALVFIVFLNGIMWMSAIAALDVNPNGAICYRVEGSIIDNSAVRSGNLTISNDPLDSLPTSATGTVTSGSSSFFTDVYTTVLGWLRSVPGLRYISAVVGAPYNVLQCMGMPSQAAGFFGTAWNLISLFVLLSFLFWGG